MAPEAPEALDVNKGSTSESSLRYALKYNLPVLLQGHPGTGKTTTVQRIAEEYGWPCEVLIASVHEPTDIAGVPVPSEDRQDLTFIALKALRRLAEYPGPSILFFDELDKAPVSMQNACLRLALEKKIDDLELPSRVRIVAAMNPPGQGGVDLIAPLANRFAHIEWMPDSNETANAIRAAALIASKNYPENVQKRIPYYAGVAAGFVKSKGWRPIPPADETSQGQAWASPRTFVQAVIALSCVDADHGPTEVRNQLVVAEIGSLGFELLAYIDECDLPDPEELLKDPRRVVAVDRQDRIFSVAMSVISAVERKPTKERVESGLQVCAELTKHHGESVAAIAISNFKKLVQNTPELTKIADKIHLPEEFTNLRTMLEYTGKVAAKNKGVNLQSAVAENATVTSTESQVELAMERM